MFAVAEIDRRRRIEHRAARDHHALGIDDRDLNRFVVDGIFLLDQLGPFDITVAVVALAQELEDAVEFGSRADGVLLDDDNEIGNRLLDLAVDGVALHAHILPGEEPEQSDERQTERDHGLCQRAQELAPRFRSERVSNILEGQPQAVHLCRSEESTPKLPSAPQKGVKIPKDESSFRLFGYQSVTEVCIPLI